MWRWIPKLLLAAALGMNIAAAAEPTGRDLIAHVERTLWGSTNQGAAEMTVITPRWERKLALRFWMERPERTFLRIDAPPKEAGIGSLRIKAEMWNYLPAIERVIKIPPSMMLQPWMGSDMTNDDLVKESSIVDDYTHTLTGSATLDGIDVYKVDSIPKPDAAVVWGKLVYYIRRSDRLPLALEYYDERGEKVKVMRYGDIRSIGGRVIPTRWEVRPLGKPQNRTVFVIRDIAFDAAVDPRIFSLSNLQQGR
ncbi:MAG TPA: outer membrane lipoprotein-sorting protein [Burkholderiales bacterium]